MRIIKKTLHGIKYLSLILLLFVSFPIAFILYGQKKYWLISEVYFDARDNGFHFFLYLNKNHPEINSVYLISKHNPNYQIVKCAGKVIEPHSYKHFLIFIAAKAKISTLVHGCSPSGYVTKYLLNHHFTGNNIALKHGIFKNIHPNYFKNKAHLDLICCGAKPEFDFIKNNFGYEDGVASYTGLARFDALHNIKAEREILIMPTWRRWIDSIKNCGDFVNTDFFKRWLGLLNDELFMATIHNNNLKVYFYVHPKLNRFISCFNHNSPNVIFLNSIGGDSIQEHLKKASILITDFSSVFFDFAYMRKPSIFFQFDEDEYYSTHYARGYFDYKRDGFGPVFNSEIDVIKEVIHLIKNNMQIEYKYLDRSNHFFTLTDSNNCERIFNAIKNII